MFSLKIVKGAELAEGVLAETRLPAPLSRFVIGRDPGANWPIPDRTLAISARHCEIVGTSGGGIALRDLSTNGTFVNGGGARVHGEHALKAGDRIELGPYTILVQGPAAQQAVALDDTADVTIHIPTINPPAGTASVEATGPVRGGDPAAMLSGGGPARVGLTELLRHAPPPEDSKLAVTKIRQAPRPVPNGPTGPAPAPTKPAALTSTPGSTPAAAVPPAPPVVAAPKAAEPPRAVDPVLAQLAAGLGLPAAALAGRDTGQTVAQVGALARAAVTVLRQLLEQQAQGRRQIGSRSPALVPVRDVNPLRLAATAEGALQALLTPGADVATPLQRAAAELSSHQERLMAAFRDAATRLGEEMAPGALEAALGSRTGHAPQLQLWELYTQLWQGIGLAPGQPWSKGFLEAALMHMAAAYDEHGKKT